MNARFAALALVLFVLQVPNGYSGTVQVPGQYKTISEAISAAQPNDTILINDSGTYSEELVINKPLSIEAAQDKTPKILYNGVSQRLITFAPGSQGTRFGSVNGGRIIVDGNLNTSGTLDYMIDFKHGANNTVTLENLSILTSGDPGCEIYYQKDDGNITFRFCEMDGRERVTRLTQVIGKARGKYVFEKCRIHGFADYGLYFECAEPDVLITKCDIRGDVTDPGVRCRKRCVAVAGENTKATMLIENSMIRGGGTASGGAVIFFMTGEEGGKSIIQIKNSLIYSPRQIALCFYQGAHVKVDHCDIISASDQPCIFYSKVPSILNAGDISITNCNVVPRSPEGKPFWGGSPKIYAFDNNNSRDPGYVANPETGDARYNDQSILKGASDGTPIGTNADFTNITAK